MTEKKAGESNILAKKKDRSIEFLIGAGVFLLIATLVYKFLISPTLVNIDMYHQAAKMYDKGEYIEAGKIFARLGSYKDSEEQYRTANMDGVNELIHYGETDAAMKLVRRLQKEIQENGANTNEMQQYKYTLEKKMFGLYMGEYEPEPEEARYLYRDMDGDGSLECCKICLNGLKYIYTCKDGKIYNLTENFYDYEEYIAGLIYEQHNLFSVMSLSSDGSYSETFYKVEGTELKTVAEKIIVPTYDSAEDIHWVSEAMQEAEKGQGYELSERLISAENFSKEGEECDASEYAAYIAKITGNEHGINGVTDKSNKWEVEDSKSVTTFEGEEAYYGGYYSAEEFINYLYDEYEYYDDYEEDEYYDDEYDDYDEDEYYEEW